MKELKRHSNGQKKSMAEKSKTFQTVIIGTFSAWKENTRLPVNGMIEPLLSYFGPRSRKIILIDCPHPGSDIVTTKIDVYKKEKIVKQYHLPFLFPSEKLLQKYNTEIKTQPLFKIRDFFSSLKILFSQNEPADLFIGLESIHTLAGIIGKRFGKVKKVVYYVSDYSPNRYSSKLFNNIYLFLDRYCATHTDIIWDVSPAMQPARIEAGLNPKKSKKVILVPNALFPWQISHKSINKLQPYSIVFAGTIGKINGLDVAIEAFAEARKTLPRLTFHILGGGVKKDEEKVLSLIKKYRLQKYIIHHGFVSDLKKVSEIVSSCMVGIAPYRAIPGSIRWYADATKIRLYFAAGLPVITTLVPPLAKEAEKAGAIVIAKDTKKNLADAIKKVFSDNDLYQKMRKNAINFAQNNTWENTYEHAVRESYQR